MSVQIIDRGRGPEVEGTRVTVYRIMDFLGEGSSPRRIAEELALTLEQVEAGLRYIEEHGPEVKAVYVRILQRVRQPNPVWVQAERSKTPEELRQRILARRAKESTHAGSSGQ